jgi:hypothetical protein
VEPISTTKETAASSICQQCTRTIIEYSTANDESDNYKGHRGGTTDCYTKNYYIERRGAMDNIPTLFSNIPALNISRLIDYTRTIKKVILPDDLGRK